MKVFLVAVSSLCLCGILLCFFAYATGNFPFVPRTYDMPKTIQPIPVSTFPQKSTTVEDAPLCSPCVEKIASILEIMESEWETDMTVFFEQLQKPSKPSAQGWVWLSSEQQEQAKQLFDEYGTAEGLRRLREMDPDDARRFERERRGAPKDDDYSDGRSHDDSP